MEQEIKHKRPEVKLRYTVEEFARLKKAFARSTHRTISSYIRRLSLGQPVEIITRNASFDAFVGEIISLKTEMKNLSEQKDLSPATQAALIHLHEDIRSAINKIVQLCMQ